MAEAQEELADALSSDLLAIARGHSKFAPFRTDRIVDSASLLVRYGLGSIETFRTTEEQARRYLFEDLRKTEQLNVPNPIFLCELDQHVRPNDQKLSGKNIRFAKLDIPRELAPYAPLLSNLSSHFLPAHDMVNWIQKEIAISSAKGPFRSVPYAEAFRSPHGCPSTLPTPPHATGG